MNLKRLVQTFYLLFLFLNGLVFMQPLSAATLNDGVVGYWSFDDCTANDNSNNGLSGTAYSGVSCVQSAWGKAFSFDGTNGYVEIPYPQALTGGSSFTASFLMQFNPLNKRQWVLFFGEPSRWVSAHWLIRENNISQFGFYSDGIAQGMYSLIDLSPFVTKWTHVVTTYDANTNQLISYINGVKQSTDYPATKANLLPSKFYIGKNVYSASDANYSGNLDELRLYNRALSGLEVAQLYNSIQNHPVQYSANGHYYEYVPEVVDWNTAKQRAESKTYQGMKGHLATITSAAENNFVNQSFPNTAGYLGATDKETNGTWKWVTGEAFSYTNWYPGEPNDSCGESYLHFFRGSNGKWNDIDDDNQCHNLASYVSGYYIEYEPAYTKSQLGDFVDIENSIIDYQNNQIKLRMKVSPDILNYTLSIGDKSISVPRFVETKSGLDVIWDVVFDFNLHDINYLNKLIEVRVWSGIRTEQETIGTIYGVNDQAKSSVIAFRALSDTYPTLDNKCITSGGIHSPCNNYFASDEVPGINADSNGLNAKANFFNTVTHRIIDFDKVVRNPGINLTWNQSNYGRQPGGDNGRIPLLLVHGWQGNKGLRNPAKLGLWENSELRYWQHFLDYYLTSSELQNRFHVYLYHYTTYKHVTYNAKILNDLLDDVAQNQPFSDLARPKLISAGKPQDALTIVAHSMGGMVSRSLLEEYRGLDMGGVVMSQLNQLITLDTPHHGSFAANPVWLKDAIGGAVKDLTTQGAYDLIWDNYDSILKNPTLTTSDIQEYKWETSGERAANDREFDITYCNRLPSVLGQNCSLSPNPWLMEMNYSFSQIADSAKNKYILYAAWMANPGIFNFIDNQFAFEFSALVNSWDWHGLSQTFKREYPNGGAEPITSALLSTYTNNVNLPLDPSCKESYPSVFYPNIEKQMPSSPDEFYSWHYYKESVFPESAPSWLVNSDCQNIVDENYQLRSILISNNDARAKVRHPYGIPFRIFWDYDHEFILNGAYKGYLGVFDKYIDPSKLSIKNSNDMASVFSDSAYTGMHFTQNTVPFTSQQTRNHYAFVASNYLKKTRGLNPITDFNQVKSLVFNPLITEPVFLMIEADLTAPPFSGWEPKLVVPSQLVIKGQTKVTLTNAGGNPLVLSKINITGTHKDAFAALNISETGACARIGSGSLLPGKSCTISVLLRPNMPYQGSSRQAILEISSNDPVSPVSRVALSATIQ